ncbi:uncharacterized protein O3C94_016840 isoform 2-T2 [Discoglossus pictus]
MEYDEIKVCFSEESGSSEGKRMLYKEKHIEFDEVAVYFSKEEWKWLNEEQKVLYKNVMLENYQTLVSLGCVHVKPSVVSKIERGEEPYVWCYQKFYQESNTAKGDLSIDTEVAERRSALLLQRSLDEQTLTWTEYHKGQKKNSIFIASDVSMNWTCSEPRNPAIYTEENTNESQIYDEWGNHTGKKQFPCPDCGKCYATTSGLSRHQKIHTGKDIYTCPECEKSFTTKFTFVRHRQIHAEEKRFVCSVCRECFSRNTYLIKHQQNHTTEELYTCSKCGVYFSKRASFLRHQEIHTGEKRFSCSQCGKCFTRKHYLILHERIHKGEITFSCSECGKYCRSNSELTVHMRIHTGEKPFACLDCGKCFNSSSSLFRHQKIHTSRGGATSDACGAMQQGPPLEQPRTV